MNNLADQELCDGLESINGSGTTLDTPKAIADFKLIATRSALHLEAIHGVRMSRSYSAYQVVKERFGLKGSKAKVFAEFDAYVTERTGVTMKASR